MSPHIAHQKTTPSRKAEARPEAFLPSAKEPANEMVHMLDTLLLSSIARQMMSADEVEVEGKRLPVRRTSKQGLRTVTFTMGGPQYAAIEQNPDKPSRWGQLARSGHQVVQFKDVETNRFVAVAVDGEAKEYGGGKRRGHTAEGT